MSFGCGGKPAVNENRMNKELSDFAACLLPLLWDTARQTRGNEFNELAIELFTLQFKYNPAYQRICRARRVAPECVGHWTQIPAVPTAVFKELELTCLASSERTAVFHSSGTTEQTPSRHFHSAESIAVYEASLWSWFVQNVLSDLRFTIYDWSVLPHRRNDRRIRPSSTCLKPSGVVVVSAVLSRMMH